MANKQNFTDEERAIFYKVARQYTKEDALNYFVWNACGIDDYLDLGFADGTDEESFVGNVLSYLVNSYYSIESMEWSANTVWDEVFSSWKDNNETDYNHMAELVCKWFDMEPWFLDRD